MHLATVVRGGQVRTRAARTQPVTALQGTGIGAAAWDGARRLQQTPRPTRRAGAVQRYQRRCVPATHLSSFLPGEGGELERGGFPAMATSLRTLSVLGSPRLASALQEATRLACGHAW